MKACQPHAPGGKVPPRLIPAGCGSLLPLVIPTTNCQHFLSVLPTPNSSREWLALRPKTCPQLQKRLPLPFETFKHLFADVQVSPIRFPVCCLRWGAQRSSPADFDADLSNGNVRPAHSVRHLHYVAENMIYCLKNMIRSLATLAIASIPWLPQR